MGDTNPVPERVPSHLEDKDAQAPTPLTDFPATEVEAGDDEEEEGEDEEVESAPPALPDRKSTRLNSSHRRLSRMPSSA